MKKFGIRKEEHLKLQNEILSVFRNGKQYSDRYLKIYVMQNKKLYSKFAVVINKKFGKSIQRNKAKRQVRELYRVNKSKQKRGYNIIFFIKNGFKDVSFSKKKENYLQLIKKADLSMSSL